MFVYYSLFSIGIAAWLASQFFVDNNIISRLSLGLGLFIVEMTVGFFVLFSYSFPDRASFPKKYILIPFIPALLFGPFSFSAYIATINTDGRVEYGLLYDVQTLMLICFIVVGISFLVRSFFVLDKSEKGQLRLLLVAFLPFVAASYLTGVTFADNNSVQFLRPLAALTMILIIIYAMARKQLFNIRSFVVRATAYTLTTIVLAFLYIGPFIYVLMLLLGMPFRPLTFIMMVMFGTVVAINYERVKNWFNKVTNKIFFRDAYRPAELMSDLNRMLIGSVDAQTLVSSAAKVINGGLKPLYCYFILFSETKHGNAPRFIGDGMNTEKEMWLSEVIKSVKNNQHNNGLTTEQLPQNSELRAKLLEHDVAASIKLISPTSKGRILGYMLVGVRKSGKTYDAADTQVLEAIASTLTIALQNALHFEEISQFNVTLQQKIDNATQQLQKSNAKLIALDEAKDDFISMASHQLRTPLTSIKGYLSMVLEGDAGELRNDLQRQMIDQAYNSSQRMTYLIADLLNLSRLKTGKFVIEPTAVDLSALISQEISQVRATAEARKINLIFDEPKNFPTIYLDETKTRQVVMNFIDNAIYYTKSGGEIVVKLEDKGSAIECTVADNGIGIPKNEQHNLFSRFFRASNAKKVRPDGTGLGLFMVRKVVVAQGGAIIFHSEEGRGSTFGFTIPKDNKVTAISEEKTVLDAGE